MTEQVIWPNAAVAWAFGSGWTGFELAAAILVAALVIVLFNYLKFHRPMLGAQSPAGSHC